MQCVTSLSATIGIRARYPVGQISTAVQLSLASMCNSCLAGHSKGRHQRKGRTAWQHSRQHGGELAIHAAAGVPRLADMLQQILTAHYSAFIEHRSAQALWSASAQGTPTPSRTLAAALEHSIYKPLSTSMWHRWGPSSRAGAATRSPGPAARTARAAGCPAAMRCAPSPRCKAVMFQHTNGLTVAPSI